MNKKVWLGLGILFVLIVYLWTMIQLAGNPSLEPPARPVIALASFAIWLCSIAAILKCFFPRSAGAPQKECSAADEEEARQIQSDIRAANGRGCYEGRSEYRDQELRAADGRLGKRRG